MCVHNCGKFRNGHEYELGDRPSIVALQAVRAGYLVANSGWCAPSETVYSQVNAVGEELLSVPELSVERGGIPSQPAEKPRKARKKAAAPDTLESLSEASSQALDALRGPSGI